MIEDYHYPLLILLTALLVAFFCLVRSVFEGNGPAVQVLLCALAFGVYYVVCMPKASASMFWVDGALQYHAGGVFYLLALGALYKLFREKDSTILPALLSMVFVFAAIGTTETCMVSLFSTVTAMYACKLLQRNSFLFSFPRLSGYLGGGRPVWTPENETGCR